MFQKNLSRFVTQPVQTQLRLHRYELVFIIYTCEGQFTIFLRNFRGLWKAAKLEFETLSNLKAATNDSIVLSYIDYIILEYVRSEVVPFFTVRSFGLWGAAVYAAAVVACSSNMYNISSQFFFYKLSMLFADFIYTYVGARGCGLWFKVYRLTPNGADLLRVCDCRLTLEDPSTSTNLCIRVYLCLSANLPKFISTRV